MSLRRHAKILGVSHSLLSKCINGKRRWNPELKERYDRLVTSVVTKSGTGDSLAFLSPSVNSADKTGDTVTNSVYNTHSSSCGAVAHLGERFNGIEEVGSSSLPSSTTVLFLPKTASVGARDGLLNS